MFPFRRGAPLELARVCRALHAEYRRLGLPPITMRAFLHLYASLLLDAGLLIPEVSRRLGHINATITMTIYAHALAHDGTAAVRAMEWVLGE